MSKFKPKYPWKARAEHIKGVDRFSRGYGFSEETGAIIRKKKIAHNTMAHALAGMGMGIIPINTPFGKMIIKEVEAMPNELVGFSRPTTDPIISSGEPAGSA